MSKLLLLSFFLLTLSLTQSIEPCECENNGSCSTYNQTDNQVYHICTCIDNFLDRRCTISSQQINQTKQTFTITQNYSYFYTQLNYSVVYLIQIYFCPKEFQTGDKYQLYIEFQKQDNSITQDLSSKQVETFLPVVNQCMLFRTPIADPYMKIDGTSPKLVVRLRNLRQSVVTPSLKDKQFQQGSKKQFFNQHLNRTMTITAYRYPLYSFENFNFGDYLIIFTITALFLTSLAFFILNRSMRNRRDLFHQRIMQAAQPINSIDHFDTIMPPVIYPKKEVTQQQSEEDQKQCMICFMGLTETQIRTTPCGHLFHKECIDKWGHKQLICPACRGSLKDSNHFEIV